MLVLVRKPLEEVVIRVPKEALQYKPFVDIVVSLVGVGKEKARLGFEAHCDVVIHRSEVTRRIPGWVTNPDEVMDARD